MEASDRLKASREEASFPSSEIGTRFCAKTPLLAARFLPFVSLSPQLAPALIILGPQLLHRKDLCGTGQGAFSVQRKKARQEGRTLLFIDATVFLCAVSRLPDSRSRSKLAWLSLHPSSRTTPCSPVPSEQRLEPLTLGEASLLLLKGLERTGETGLIGLLENRSQEGASQFLSLMR